MRAIETVPARIKELAEARAAANRAFYRYLKESDSLQFSHQAEIDRLLERDPSLHVVYHQETGKRDARVVGRRLARLGLRNAWFALYYGEVIAGGSTRAEVARVVSSLLPAEQRDLAYLFYLKGAKHVTATRAAGED